MSASIQNTQRVGELVEGAGMWGVGRPIGILFRPRVVSCSVTP